MNLTNSIVANTFYGKLGVKIKQLGESNYKKVINSNLHLHSGKIIKSGQFYLESFPTEDYGECPGDQFHC